MLDTTVAYAKDRHQFGQAIGAFQAVKHHLADAALILSHARPAVHRAAYTMTTRDVSMAKVLASDAAARTARAALQCHGAIGYSWEHDLHLWMKRTWVLERRWGDAAHHTAIVADELGL
jgi:alkylation response protein AidB-like acyl-CoA dehydrogenase